MLELNRVAGFEIAKLCCSEELAFRVPSRRNKLLGLWAASQLGMPDGDAENYARDLVAAGVQRFGDEAVLTRILRDLAAHGADVLEDTVRSEMKRLTHLAALEHGAASDRPRSAAA